MAVDTTTVFAQVIHDHLELKRRNSELDGNMPLDRYKYDDPFDNHPLFKSEEQARIEETMDGEEAAITTESVSWPIEEVSAHAVPVEESDEADSDSEGLWSRSRDFDWGD